ncbi:MAG: diaminopimelate epimerase, partial [Acidimicrobiales bacterium]
MTLPSPAACVRLVKLHGLGNDFLVWLTDAGTAASTDVAGLARKVCDRHRGIGADGLLVGTPPGPNDGAGADIVMVLHNADGSRAEMSGNGVRCFVHAVARAGGMTAGTLRVATDAGLREVAFTPDSSGDTDTLHATVDMGPVTAGPAPDTDAPEPAAGPEASPQRQATADIGNPHLVLMVDDPAKVDIGTVGPQWEARYSHGINVHFVTPSADGAALVVHTWERGAGLTEACGTGAAAAAAVVHGWGLVGDDIAVHMPGGDVRVQLNNTVTLIG